MKERIGVYICHCGGNISDYVDTEKVRETVKAEEGVLIAKDVMFACADSTQKEIVDDIKGHKLDGLVVASCSPKLHLYTFRNVAERAGLNPYNYVQANIREQCSWTHTDKPKEATIKAIRLVRSAINRVKHSQALSQFEISAKNAVLVVGAGVAGMRAAIDLADMGSEVILVEKKHFVGGNTALMGDLFTTDERGDEIVHTLYDEIQKRERISLFTGAEVTTMKGSVGDFAVKISIKPRYIKPGADTERVRSAMKHYRGEACPDEYNFGITSRKPIYMPDKACPDKPAIYPKCFNPNDDFLSSYSDCIDMGQKTERIDINVGAIMLSTGFDAYEPAEGEYGYKQSDKIVTLQQFKRLIELNAGNELMHNQKPVKNVVFIYCVGSRQKEDEDEGKEVNQYCSRYCCTSAIHTSLLLRKKYEGIHTYHLYRDIRTYGKQELLYDEASLKGDIFCKFDEEEPPVVEVKHNSPRVVYKDLLFDNEAFEIEPDMVVLVTGMVPRNDSKTIAGILKTPIGSDKFFNEVHPKLRPVETVIDGIFIAGTCQGPKNITETMNSALAAASKANSLINSGKIELEPTIISIDTDACSWCGKCVEICPYDALSKITTDDGKEVAKVNKSVCKGCGICAPVCPENAIDIVGYTDKEIESMIDGLIKTVE